MAREAYTVLNAPLPKISSDCEKSKHENNHELYHFKSNKIHKYQCHIFINRISILKQIATNIIPLRISQSDPPPQIHIHNQISHQSNQHRNPFFYNNPIPTKRNDLSDENDQTQTIKEA